MVICVDSREHPTSEAKRRWESFGVPYRIQALKSGDYTSEFVLPSGKVFSLENVSDNKFWFDCGDLDISSYSVLIGVNNEKNLSLDGSDIKVEYIAPYETRVYYIGDDKKEMLFTDKRLFLRGDMNGWGYDEMLYDSEKRCFDLWYKLDPDSYQFKFDAYCDWTLSYGSGEENTAGKTVPLDKEMQTSTEKGENTNFLFTPSSSGTYRFTFYEDDNTFVIRQE